MNDGIDILIDGEIEELHHQDYNGKRINIILKDENNFSLSSKLDIGVHANFDIKQDEYCFNLESLEESASLIINSKEQIICEKLKSLLRFGIRTTRYKDIFDIYYLINNTDINKDELLNIIHLLIINDKTMKENNLNDIVKNLTITINNSIFKRNLSDVKNNWLQGPINVVINSIVVYFETLEPVKA